MKEIFSEMRSQSYHPGYLSGLRWGIVILLAAAAIAMLVLLSKAFSATDPDVSIAMIYVLIFLIAGGGSGWMAYEQMMNKDKKISSLLVNHIGILFLNHQGKVLSEVKYQDLVKTKDLYSKDLFSESATSGKQSDFRKNLYAHEKDENGQVKKRLINLEVIPLKNKYDLIGHFLKGIQTFRPDLNIDSDVYKDFYLDEKTFRFTPQSLKKDVVTKVVIIGIVLLILIFILPLFK